MLTSTLPLCLCAAFFSEVFNKRKAQMDVTKILAELRREYNHIAEAILSLETLASGRSKQPGGVKKRGRPVGSKNKSRNLSRCVSSSIAPAGAILPDAPVTIA